MKFAQHGSAQQAPNPMLGEQRDLRKVPLSLFFHPISSQEFGEFVIKVQLFMMFHLAMDVMDSIFPLRCSN